MNATKLRIEPTDLSDLQVFPLRWRWTSERHALLRGDQLARIQPLREEKAKEVCRTALESFSKTPGAFEIDERLYESASRIDTLSHDVSKRWLRERLPARVPVVVSWDWACAVLTDSELFVEHWDTFCYPSSDDVSVLPFDGVWILHYWHWEQFVHARRRSTQ